jgi:hypothetical protein
MRSFATVSVVLGLLGAVPGGARGQALPFHHKIEVYRDKEGDAVVFALRLEQPFLAEEFEKSNNLRLRALDRNAYLIYPKETKFAQKHAEFYGRLRGQGKAKLRLSYEIVSENLDGSRKVDVREGDLEVTIPTEPTGPGSIFREWAKHQNAYFLNLLNYYPDETFFQYCLLQSHNRYGVAPPPLPFVAPPRAVVEESLYDVLTNSLAIQQALQRQVLTSGPRGGDQDVHISELNPPMLQSLDYEKLLEERRGKGQAQPKPHELSKLVAADQYFLHFHSLTAAGELFDLSNQWGDSLLRLFTLHALDNRLEEKLQDQLCIRRGLLTRLFADGVVSEMAVTGSDPYFVEGTDLTFLFRLKQPDVFEKAAAEWLAQVKKKYPEVIERVFNYRGYKVAARYTNDRVVSSFVIRHENTVIYSTSHAAIRKVIDVATGKAPRLFDALDYRYVTTVLPPSDDRQSGYLFAPEAFFKRLVGPEAKISEKRRVECFNNLVMLNNAALFYRLENGRSPASLTDLAQGRFVDLDKVVCPHGGAYAFDAKNDTCTCTLHNRIKYLTPNAELPVLKVTRGEREEYGRFRARYEAFWRTVFDPLAVRISMGPRVKLEVCVLPFANGSLYRDLQSWVEAKPRRLDTQRIAPSAVVSLLAVHGRKNLADLLRQLPGVPEVLKADPTLTDLSWIGDRASVHFCDGSPILEIDPSRLGTLDVPFAGKVSLAQQVLPVLALATTSLPTYVTVEVEDRDKAARLLEQLAGNLFLQRGQALGLPKTLDAYRLPEYKKHLPYVLSFQVYALKLRLHVALVGNELVAATRPELLREVIDAAANKEAGAPAQAHLLLRLNRRALRRLHDDLQLHWEEKARLACHRNTISIYNLLKLYEVPIEEVPRLTEAKYGVRPFCPDRGTYSWDKRSDQVLCSVHGNRQTSRQNPRLDQKSSFAAFIDSLDEIVTSLRFQDEALISTVEIARRAAASK